MNTVFAYILNHKHYNNVKAAYNEVITEYSDAYNVWIEHKKQKYTSSFEHKEIVFENLEEIKTIKSWIDVTNHIQNSKRDALQWFLNERGLSSIPALRYNEYKLIYDYKYHIDSLQNILDVYSQLINIHKEAIDRYLKVTKSKHSYDEIRNIVTSKEVIERYSTILTKAHSLQSHQLLAWKVFAKGRSFNDIPIMELENLKEEDFYVKDMFLSEYQRKRELIKLILGNTFLPIDSFDDLAIYQEAAVMALTDLGDYDKPEVFNVSVQLDNQDSLKRAILDSVKYGESCKFVDSYSIAQIYELRASIESIGASFDDSVKIVELNRDVIGKYNQIYKGENIVYIGDYLRCIVEGSSLYNYIKKHEEEKCQRDMANRIKDNYADGFKEILGIIDIETCSLQQVQEVIDSRELVINRDKEIKEIRRKQTEADRKKIEEKRKIQEIRDLRSCVSSWPQPYMSSIKCFSLYYYYPTTCTWKASQSEWHVRNLIWDFKASPHDYQSEEATMHLHTKSVDAILPKLKKVIYYYFSGKESKLTIVPIPASTAIVCDRRYKDILELICKDTHMYNGYPHMSIKKEGISKNNPNNHSGHSFPPDVDFDKVFFRDKYVILFDDVITSGASMERYKRLIEATGATVICGLSIGKTKHERQCSNPIDSID